MHWKRQSPTSLPHQPKNRKNAKYFWITDWNADPFSYLLLSSFISHARLKSIKTAWIDCWILSLLKINQFSNIFISFLRNILYSTIPLIDFIEADTFVRINSHVSSQRSKITFRRESLSYKVMSSKMNCKLRQTRTTKALQKF